MDKNYTVKNISIMFFLKKTKPMHRKKMEDKMLSETTSET